VIFIFIFNVLLFISRILWQYSVRSKAVHYMGTVYTVYIGPVYCKTSAFEVKAHPQDHEVYTD